MEEQRIGCARPVSHPGLAGLFGASEISAVEINELEVTAACPRIRSLRVGVRAARFLQSSDVQADGGNAVMGLLEAGLDRDHSSQRFERVSVLEALRRTPLDEG